MTTKLNTQSPKCVQRDSRAHKHKHKHKHCIPECKPADIPMTIEIAPIITLVVDKPKLHILNNAVCKPTKSKCKKSKCKKSKCKKSKCKKSKSKSPRKCGCDYYEQYYYTY
jgi:hypothetical protein